MKNGDAMFLPSGRFHAIGAGNILVEVQQNSDTTYRIFDWNRVDDRGRRQLHVDQALQCIDFNDVAPEPIKPSGELLVRISFSKSEMVVSRISVNRAARAIRHCFVLNRHACDAGGSISNAGRVLSRAGFVTRTNDLSARRRRIASARHDSDVEAAVPAACSQSAGDTPATTWERSIVTILL